MMSFKNSKKNALEGIVKSNDVVLLDTCIFLPDLENTSFSLQEILVKGAGKNALSYVPSQSSLEKLLEETRTMYRLIEENSNVRTVFEVLQELFRCIKIARARFDILSTQRRTIVKEHYDLLYGILDILESRLQIQSDISKQIYALVKPLHKEVRSSKAEAKIRDLKNRMNKKNKISSYRGTDELVYVDAMKEAAFNGRSAAIITSDMDFLSIRSAVLAFYSHPKNASTFANIAMSNVPRIYLVVKDRCFKTILGDKPKINDETINDLVDVASSLSDIYKTKRGKYLRTLDTDPDAAFADLGSPSDNDYLCAVADFLKQRTL